MRLYQNESIDGSNKCDCKLGQHDLATETRSVIISTGIPRHSLSIHKYVALAQQGRGDACGRSNKDYAESNILQGALEYRQQGNE